MKSLEFLTTEDETGFVPISELFDLAYFDVYSMDGLSDFIKVQNNYLIDDENESVITSVQISVTDEDNTYHLYISDNLSIDFCTDTKTLHFNQFPLYKKLAEWGYFND